MNDMKNFARFRRELKELCPRMGEQEIYRNWLHYLNPDVKDWQIQQEPMRGLDGKYHYIYISVFPSNDIYAGKHSWSTMDDGYHGSGDECRAAMDRGEIPVTTPLEFFRTDALALAAEADMIDSMFIIEPGVMNKVPGGDGTRHDKTPQLPITPSVGNVVIDMTALDEPTPVRTPKNCPKVVEKPRGSVKLLGNATATTKKKSSDWWPFKRLGVPVGEFLTFALDPSIKVQIVNDEDGVSYNGTDRKLNKLTKELAVGCYVSNCLCFWKWNGELLIDIENRLKKAA